MGVPFRIGMPSAQVVCAEGAVLLRDHDHVLDLADLRWGRGGLLVHPTATRPEQKAPRAGRTGGELAPDHLTS